MYVLFLAITVFYLNNKKDKVFSISELMNLLEYLAMENERHGMTYDIPLGLSFFQINQMLEYRKDLFQYDGCREISFNALGLGDALEQSYPLDEQVKEWIWRFIVLNSLEESSLKKTYILPKER